MSEGKRQHAARRQSQESRTPELLLRLLHQLQQRVGRLSPRLVVVKSVETARWGEDCHHRLEVDHCPAGEYW